MKLSFMDKFDGQRCYKLAASTDLDVSFFPQLNYWQVVHAADLHVDLLAGLEVVLSSGSDGGGGEFPP